MFYEGPFYYHRLPSMFTEWVYCGMCGGFYCVYKLSPFIDDRQQWCTKFEKPAEICDNFIAWRVIVVLWDGWKSAKLTLRAHKALRWTIAFIKMWKRTAIKSRNDAKDLGVCFLLKYISHCQIDVMVLAFHLCKMERHCKYILKSQCRNLRCYTWKYVINIICVICIFNALKPTW